MKTIGKECWKLIGSFCSNPHALACTSKSFKEISNASFESLAKAYAKNYFLENYAKYAKELYPQDAAQCVRLVYERVRQESGIEKKEAFAWTLWDKFCSFFVKNKESSFGETLAVSKLSLLAEETWAENLSILFNHFSWNNRPAREFQMILRGDPIEKACAIRFWLKNNRHEAQKALTFELGSQHLVMLPKEIVFFENLTHLSVDNSCFTRFPRELGAMTSLQKLDLCNASITDLPEVVGQLIHLQTLSLSHNKLTSLPKTIGKLTLLQTLFLTKNELTSLPETLGNLTQLHWLHLDFNSITELPDSIGNLKELEWLDVSHNKLAYLNRSIIKLQRLEILCLNYNCLTKIPPELRNLPRLHTLLLSYNPLLFSPFDDIFL